MLECNHRQLSRSLARLSPESYAEDNYIGRADQGRKRKRFFRDAFRK